MKIDVDCSIDNDQAEISISLLDRISREEFDEYADIMRREGFTYDPYTQSNILQISTPKMLSAMLKFLEKEFEVSGVLRGKEKYSWDQRNQFITDFSESLSHQKEPVPDMPKEQPTDTQSPPSPDTSTPP